LRCGLKAFLRWIDAEGARSGCTQADFYENDNSISSDFPLTLPEPETRGLGIDPDSFGSQDLPQAMYEVIKAQHSALKKHILREQRK
jgi:hypothetical protein